MRSSTPRRHDSLPGAGPSVQEQTSLVDQEKISVFVRIRPLHAQEASSGERSAWTASGDTNTTLTCTDEAGCTASLGQTASGKAPAQSSGGGSSSSTSFSYSRVFAEACDSEEVYKYATQPLVLAAMRGYNGTVFAYGQTGSGKTYTMRSLMRQSAADIFSYIKGNPSREFVLRLSAMEIYNEEVRDLMRDGGTTAHSPPGSTAATIAAAAVAAASSRLKVQDDPLRGVHVEGLIEEGLRSAEHLELLLRAVETRRHVCDTRMNQNSSRSHQVVRIYIESRPAPLTGEEGEEEGHASSACSGCAGGDGAQHQVSAEAPSSPSKAAAAAAADRQGPVTISAITLVDLAGSERLSQAAIEDVDRERLRQKEASNINKSLLTLGLVIRALGESAVKKHAKHIQYRESKLTRILQPSLSGNSHMAIICTISPAAGSLENTRAALHFANAAKNVVMHPKVNEVADDKAVIRRMKAEIEGLKKQLSTHAPHIEARDLCAALSAKEEMVRRVAEEKEGLQRRLAGLERLILRGDGQVKERHSFDASMDLASLGSRYLDRDGTAANPDALDGNVQQQQRPPAGSVRASYPAASAVAARGTDGARRMEGAHPQGRGSGLTKSGFVSGSGASALPGHESERTISLSFASKDGTAPSSGQLAAAAAAAEAAAALPPADSEPGITGAARPAVPKLDLRLLQAPAEPKYDVEAAMITLQAELTCIKHSCSHLTDIQSAIKSLQAEVARREGQHATTAAAGNATSAGAGKAEGEGSGGGGAGGPEERALVALKAEVARLQAADEATAKADHAMDALRRRLRAASIGHEDELDADAETETQALPDWLRQMVYPETSSAATPPMLSQRRLTQQQQPPGAQEEGRVTDETAAAAVPPQPTSHQPPLLSHRYMQADSFSSIAAVPLIDEEDGEEDEEDGDDVAESRNVAACSPAVAAASAAAKAPGGRLEQSVQGKAAAAAAAAGVGGSSSSRSRTITPRSTNSRRRTGVATATSGEVAAAAATGQAEDASRGNSNRDTTHGVSDQGSDAAALSMPFGASEEDLKRKCSSGTAGHQQAVKEWYKSELRRITVAFKASAERDVKELGAALDGLREHADRLEMQKRLLLNQVLRLEEELSTSTTSQESMQQKMQALVEERDSARRKVEQVKTWARAAEGAAREHAASAQEVSPAAGGGVGGQGGPSGAGGGAGMEPLLNIQRQLSIFDADDSWAAKDTPETLLPKILEAWEKLAVPLVYRSRFFLDLKEKDVFYYEMEYRRLEWKTSRIDAASNGYGGKSKELDRAIQALDWEHKSLAQNLKWTFTDEQRAQLMQDWGVNLNTKGRKLQTVRRLWHPQTLRQPGGAQRSAELVVRLTDVDASGQFMELVFGENRINPGTRPSPLGMVTNIVQKMVATPRNRPPQSPGQQHSGHQPQQSSSEVTASTPRHNSMIGSFTSRLRGSFMSKRGHGAAEPSILNNVSQAAAGPVYR